MAQAKAHNPLPKSIFGATAPASASSGAPASASSSSAPPSAQSRAEGHEVDFFGDVSGEPEDTNMDLDTDVDAAAAAMGGMSYKDRPQAQVMEQMNIPQSLANNLRALPQSVYLGNSPAPNILVQYGMAKEHLTSKFQALQASVQTENATLRAQIADLAAQMNNANAQLAAIQAQGVAVQNENVGLQAQVGALQGVISEQDPIYINARKWALHQFATDGNGPAQIAKRKKQLHKLLGEYTAAKEEMERNRTRLGAMLVRGRILEEKVKQDAAIAAEQVDAKNKRVDQAQALREAQAEIQKERNREREESKAAVINPQISNVLAAGVQSKFT